jgi:hypothetical protein
MDEAQEDCMMTFGKSYDWTFHLKTLSFFRHEKFITKTFRIYFQMMK